MPTFEPDFGEFDQIGEKPLFIGFVQISAKRTANWIGKEFPIDVSVRVDGDFALPILCPPRRMARLTRLFGTPPDPDEIHLRLRLSHAYVRIDSTCLYVRDGTEYREKVPTDEFRRITEQDQHNTTESGWRLGAGIGAKAPLHAGLGKLEVEAGAKMSDHHQAEFKTSIKVVSHPYRIENVAHGWRITEPASYLDGLYRNQGRPWCSLAFRDGETAGTVGFTLAVRDGGLRVERTEGGLASAAEMRDAMAEIVLLSQQPGLPRSPVKSEMPIASVTFKVVRAADESPSETINQPLSLENGQPQPRRRRMLS